jgi:CheY-like chemotaxis protein
VAAQCPLTEALREPQVLELTLTPEPPQLLVCDENFGLDSTLMKGSAAIQLIREHEAQEEQTAQTSTAKIAIVSCTGNCTEDDALQMRQAGADAVWGKPFPSFMDGTMQKCLSEVLQAKGHC